MKYLAHNICVAIALNFCIASVFAADQEHRNVTSFLKKLFDHPNDPLSVDAVAVSGHYSLASWHQKVKGGRALLKKTGDKWEIVMCGGKDLRQASALEKSGLPARDASLLVKSLTYEESKLPADRRRSFDEFDRDRQPNHHVQN